MRSLIVPAILAGIGIASFAPLMAHADVTGDTFSETFNFGEPTDVYCNSGSFVAGSTSGADCTNQFSYSITNDQLTLTATSSGGWGSFDFNGPVFTDLSQSLAGYTATLDSLSTEPDFEATLLDISGSSLYVNWEGENYISGDTIVIDLSPSVAPTPEPSSMVLLGTGLLSLAGISRRRLFPWAR